MSVAAVAPLDLVEPQVAGRMAMPLPMFYEALGTPGKRVWHILRGLRAKDGTCSASAREIAEGTHLSAAYIEKGLKRLVRMQLVTSARGTKDNPRKRSRMVFGTIGVSTRGDLAMVPHEAWKALQQARGHGGQRVGSGRPKGPKNGTSIKPDSGTVELRVMTDEINQEAESKIKRPKEGPERIKRPKTAPNQGAESSGDQPPFRGADQGPGGTSPEGGGSRARVRARAHSLSLEAKEVVVSPEGETQRRVGEPTAGQDLFFDGTTAHGTKLQGNGSRAIGWQLPGVPAMPGPALVKIATLPMPPKIDPDWPPDSQVDFLVKTWEHAVEHRWGTAAWNFRGKNYPTMGTDKFVELEAAVALFIEFEVPPAQWLHFCFELWTNVTSKEKKEIRPTKKGRKRRNPKHPPPRWCWSRKLFEDHRGWFRREYAPQVLGGRRIYTPNMQLLTNQHALMRDAIMVRKPESQEQIDRIVAYFFPETRYDDLLAAAQQEAFELQRDLTSRAYRGEWVWA